MTANAKTVMEGPAPSGPRMQKRFRLHRNPAVLRNQEDCPMRHWIALTTISCVMVFSSITYAAPHDAEIHLDHGVANLPFRMGTIDLHALQRSRFLQALNESIG